MTVWRPVHEACRKKIWFFLDQTELGAENELVRLESLEDGDLRPFRQPKLTLQLVGISNLDAFGLKTEREVPGRLQVWRHDLAEAFCCRMRRASKDDGKSQKDCDGNYSLIKKCHILNLKLLATFNERRGGG